MPCDSQRAWSTSPPPPRRSRRCGTCAAMLAVAAILTRSGRTCGSAQRCTEKKHVNLVLVQNPKDNKSYYDAMRQSKGVQEFRGRAGVEHRVFVLSCDLMNQSGKTPWATASLPDADILEACCQFLLAHARGPYDIIMAWDGCQRKSRRTLEDSVGQLHTCAEVFMVYTKSWNHWAAQKVFLGSENTECGYINTPLGRTKKFIKHRGGGFNAAGEETSHYVSFTGVVPPSRMSLARITPANNSRSSRTRRPTCPALGPIQRPVSRCSGLKQKVLRLGPRF